MNEKLILRHQQNNSVHYIHALKRISYKLKDDEKLYHGRLTSIKRNSIIVNEKEIIFSDFTMIHSHPLSLSLTRVVGIILIVIGLIFAFYGFSLIRYSKQGYSFDSFMLYIVGALFVVIGTAGDFLGIIPFLTHTRKYNLETDWKIDTQ